MKTETLPKAADGGNTPPSKKIHSFRDFLLTDECRDIIGPEFVDRALRSGTTITTRTGLCNFARERWHSQYKDWRTPTPNEPYGREAMGALWARYLQAREQ